MEFKNTRAENTNLLLIRSLLAELMRLAKGKKVVLLLDEIQHLITDKAFDDFADSGSDDAANKRILGID